MKAKKITFFLGCMAAAVAATAATDYAKYVDPTIGTGGHGHVFLGANVPFGMVQLGPSQPVKGWDWCSGYHASDSVLLGFSHLHLSGTGIGDLGDVLFRPATNPSLREIRFTHDDETVRPGYYSVNLPEAGVKAELTATERTGLHRYTTANPSDSLYVTVDLRYGIGWDNLKGCDVALTTPTSIEGFRRSRGWANDQRTFFVADFSRPMARFESNDTVALCVFAPSAKPLVAKVGISAVSMENAARNLAAENSGWDFDGIAAQAYDKWNDQLGRIAVTTSSDKQRRIFYTALYHSMFAPSLFSDVNGDYHGADGKYYNDPAHKHYTTFSLWDTYRAAHPLYTLILPEMQPDLARTFIDIADQQGKLPVWHLVGNETNCMVGNPGAIVLADLFGKGFVADSAAAFDALKRTAMLDERSLSEIKKYGYIPYDIEDGKECVAKGMEYAIADDAIAKVARAMGNKADADYFHKRGQAYRHYYDPTTGFMRGKSADGKFRDEVYSPFATAHRADDYCEGNGWQYLWLVPQDPHGLIQLIGGEKKFLDKLDGLFVAQGDLGAEASPDISGLIGQYAHGNEPSHHTVYLYNYAGKPEKSAPILRKVLTELYTDQPDGLCGNEDVGQMSAWYVLSSIGLYQVEPASGKYVIGTPVMDSAAIQVGPDRTFTVVAENNSPTNIYVQSATLNGKPLRRGYLNYSEIAAGGKLVLKMGPKPSSFGTAKNARP